MGLNKSNKGVVALVVTGVLCVIGIVNFFSDSHLDVGKAKSEIESMLVKYGLAGAARCPESDFVVGQRIVCTASLSTGENVPVWVTPTNATDANIYAPNLWPRENAEQAVTEQLGKHGIKAEVSCPATTQVLMVGEVMKCDVRAADGSRAIATIKKMEGDDNWIDFEKVESRQASR